MYIIHYRPCNSMDMSSLRKCNSRSTGQEIFWLLLKSRVQYRVHKSPPLDSVLQQRNPVHIKETHDFEISYMRWSHYLCLWIPSYPSPLIIWTIIMNFSSFSPLIYVYMYTHPHRWCLHLIMVVVGFECSWNPESYVSGSVDTGRVTHAGQVKG
jgi:hypothetical protein